MSLAPAAVNIAVLRGVQEIASPDRVPGYGVGREVGFLVGLECQLGAVPFAEQRQELDAPEKIGIGVGFLGGKNRRCRGIWHVVDVVHRHQQELLDIGPGVHHDEEVSRKGRQQSLGDLPPLAGVVAQCGRVAEGELTQSEVRVAVILVAGTARGSSLGWPPRIGW